MGVDSGRAELAFGGFAAAAVTGRGTLQGTSFDLSPMNPGTNWVIAHADGATTRGESGSPIFGS